MRGARQLKAPARVASAGRNRIQERRASARIERQLVWIFGSPRSGSTWLLQLLGEHPCVVQVNEPLIGMYLSPFLCDQPGWGSATLDSSNFTIRKVQANRPGQFFAKAYTDVWLPAFAEFMRKRFVAQLLRYPPAAGIGNARVVIKEPNGSQSADVIMAALPDSRLLFLLRDGRDVVDSDVAANRKGAWGTGEFPGARGLSDEIAQRLDFVEISAKKWLWRTEVTQQAFAAHGGPKYLLRYEELLQEPVRHLSEIFKWLELDTSEDQVRAIVAKHDFESLPEEQRGEKSFWRSATPGGWRANLAEAEQEKLREVLGPKLRELGYEV